MKILISDFDRTFFDDNYLNNIELVNKFVDLPKKIIWKIITNGSKI